MMSGQKSIHLKNKSTGCLFQNHGTIFPLAVGLSSLVCASVRKKPNHSRTAGLTLEPDSSSMIEVYVGFRAGGLRWCIFVRTVLYM